MSGEMHWNSIGPVLNLVIAGVVAWITYWFRELRWQKIKELRDRKAEAYSQTIFHLYHAIPETHKIAGTQTLLVAKDDYLGRMAHLVEVQRWMTWLYIYCSKPQKAQVREVRHKLFEEIARFRKEPFGFKIPDRESGKEVPAKLVRALPEVIEQSLDDILSCAEKDLIG